MAKKLALLCDAQRIFTHQDTPIDQELVIGVTLQLAFSEDFDDSDARDTEWTKLWRWQPILSCDCWFFGATEPIGAPQPLVANVPVIAMAHSPDPTAAADALDRRLESLLSDGKRPAFTWEYDRQDSPPPEEGHVIQVQSAAARTANSVGYSLNLCAAVRISSATIPYTGNVLPANAKVLILPRLRFLSTGTGAVDVTFVPKSSTPPTEPTNGELVPWEYDRTVTVGVPELFGYTSSIDLEAGDTAGRFIQIGTGWVRRALDGSSSLDPGDDWATKLRDRVADNWDLARHLLDAAQTKVAIPSLDFPQYWDAILAVLRDRAGLGLIDTTDGNGLLRFAIQQAAPLDTSGNIPSTKDTAIRDGQLRSLQAKVRVAERWDPSLNYADVGSWWQRVRSVMPPELAARLIDIPTNPEPRIPVPVRNITLSWPPGANADLLFPAAGEPVVHLRVYANRDDDVSTSLVSVDDLQNARRTRTADNGAEIGFDAYQQDIILPAGWYEAAVQDNSQPPPHPGQPSRRVFVPGQLLKDLDVLARVWAELQSAPTLARLIGDQWQTLAQSQFQVAANRASPPWFTVVWTKVADDTPNYTVSREELGDICPLDGRTWVLTLGSVRHDAGAGAVWADGEQFALEFARTYGADGLPPVAVTTIVLRITLQTVTGQKQLKFELVYHTAGGDVIIETQTANVVGAPFHLRLEIDATRQRELNLRVNVSDDTSTSPVWTLALTKTLPSNELDRVGFRLQNDLGGTPPALRALPPSLLVVPAPLENLPEIRDAWLPALDQGLQLWQQTGAGTVSLLPQLALARRLALGQTARLVAIWYKQLPAADPNYPGYLRAKLSEQLVQYVGDRLDAPAGTQGGSIYRDFLPRVTAPGLPPTLLQLVEDHLKTVADQVELLPPELTGHFTQQRDDRICTPAPHPLHLQVDRPAMFSDTFEQGRDNDLLRRLSGFGVMMQQANANATATSPDAYFNNQPWQLLNCIDVGVLKPVLPPESEPLYEFYEAPISNQNLLTAIPLQYQDQIRHVTVTYENRHLGALDPLADVADAFDFANQSNDSASSTVPDLKTLLPPFQHRIPSPAQGGNYDWGALPTLKFGQLYRLMAFAMGNGGNLPRLLTGGVNNHPADLRLAGITQTQFDNESSRLGDATVPLYFENVLHRLMYLRRVGIGVPRLETATWPNPPTISADLQRALLPAIPADVRPLAREWELNSLTSTMPTLRWAYSDRTRTGDVLNTQNWVLVVPRVTVAGSSDDDDGPGIQFDFVVGLASGSGTSHQLSGLRIGRNGSHLTVGIGSTQTNSDLDHPAVGPVTGGPLDFRVAFTGGNLFLAWRRSDRDEAWLPWMASGELVGPIAAAASASWIEIAYPAGTPPNDNVVTFGTPEFNAGTTATRNDDHNFIDGDRLDVERLSINPAPLVVRRPSDGDFGFFLRVPSIDLETWDAWTGMERDPDDEDEAELRKAIWYRHKLWSSSSGKDDRTTPYDGSIDDPAVERLLVELVPLRADSSQSVNREVWSPSANNIGTDPISSDPHNPFSPLNPLNAVQKLQARFNIKTIKILQGAPTPRLRQISSASFEVTLQEQEIWQLRVYPMVRNAFFEAATNAAPGKQRFHSDFCEGATYVHAGVTYRLFEPWRLLMEIATREVIQLPTQDAELDFRSNLSAAAPTARPQILADTRAQRQQLLLESLKPQFVGRFVEAKLRKTTPRVFRYTGQIRLLRQVWRWRGRPVPPFPVATVNSQSSGLDQFPSDSLDPAAPPVPEIEAPSIPILWDAIGFGDRSPIDILDETRAITSDQSAATLFREDLSNDWRALYYRFTLHATSRYAGLYLNDPPVVMASESMPVTPNNPDSRNAWRRLFVPCRREETPPRPAVRFIVPLTQSEEDAPVAKVPGLLIVLDDTWFSVGGLAESLQAEVVQTNDYWDTRRPSGDLPPRPRPEFGPDPTDCELGWTRSATGEAGDGDSVPTASLAMDLVGPIGHTFDTDADAPLYDASSFVLRPPAVDGVDRPGTNYRSLDWYFAKVRFRRLLLPEAFVGYQLLPAVLGTLAATVPLTLDDSQAWIVDVANVTIVQGPSIQVEVTLGGSGGSPADIGGRGLVRITPGTSEVVIEWLPTNPLASSGAVEIKVDNLRPWTHARFDIRFILQLDGEAGVTNAGQPAPPPRHLAVQYRIAGFWDGDPDDPTQPSVPLGTSIAQRNWRTLDTQIWPGEGTWPSELTVTPTGPVSWSPPAIFPARLSGFSAPQWVQFLPDSQLLLPALDGDGSSILEHRSQFVLSWAPTPSPISRWSLLSVNESGTVDVTHKLLEPVRPPNPDADVTFHKRVLLTEVVSDVRGQLGHEKYLGLFQLNLINPSNAILEQVHLSPVLRQADLRPDAPPPGVISTNRRLRGRVVEWQIVQEQRPGAPRLASEVWSELFPRGDAASNDSQTRIVRISPPMELLETFA